MEISEMEKERQIEETQKRLKEAEDNGYYLEAFIARAELKELQEFLC